MTTLSQFTAVEQTTDWQADVQEFHDKFGCYTGSTPDDPGDEVADLRIDLINEEHMELLTAIGNSNLPEVADGIVDLIYVLLGTAIAFGIDVHPIWKAVHAANMAKTGGPVRGDGKILKPMGWVAPDVAGLIEKQKSTGTRS